MNKTKPGRPVGSFKHIVPTREGGKLSPQYRRYQAMLQRCFNPKHKGYRHYGGRGITVCDQWRGKQGFDNFVTDMGEPPTGMTLDRIDNAKGYSPDNCRWATWDVQAKNRRPAPDKRDPNSLRQRALAAGLPYAMVYQRCRLHGWTEEQALSTPSLGHGKPPGGWNRDATRVKTASLQATPGTASKMDDGQMGDDPSVA